MRITRKSHLAKGEDSMAIRIPRHVAKAIRLRQGEPLSLSGGEDGAVPLRPTRRTYRLEELVSGITPRNQHLEADWGAPVGKEFW